MKKLRCWARLNSPLVYYFWCFCPLASALYQITPEKPIDLIIKACSHEKSPMQEDTMLFFPETYKFCSSLRTSKNVISLAKEKVRTTFLQPLVQITLHEVGAPYRCKIEFLGYGGEYRLSPDLGYYPTCQKPISQYISQLAASVETPSWNITTSNCPIQSLPSKYRDYLSCELVNNRWYELYYKSSIRYEVFHKHRYHQAWSNHTVVFLFKPDNFVERNGSQLDWLQRLVDLQAKQKNCQRARYLIRVDENWPLPITVFIDYQIKENGYIKFLKHLGNGTLDQWFSGAFPIEHSDRAHEICIQMVWRGAMNRFRMCRTFLQPGECRFGTNSAPQGSLPSAICWIFALFLGHLLIN